MGDKNGFITSQKAIYFYMLGEDNYTDIEQNNLRDLIGKNTLTEDELIDCWEVYVYYHYKRYGRIKEDQMKKPRRVKGLFLREWSPELRLANEDIIRREWEDVYIRLNRFNTDNFKSVYKEFKEKTGRSIEIPISTKDVDKLGVELEEGKNTKMLEKSKDGYVNMYIEQFYPEYKVYTMESILSETDRIIEEGKRKNKMGRRADKSIHNTYLLDKAKGWHTHVFTGMTLKRTVGF